MFLVIPLEIQLFSKVTHPPSNNRQPEKASITFNTHSASVTMTTRGRKMHASDKSLKGHALHCTYRHRIHGNRCGLLQLNSVEELSTVWDITSRRSMRQKRHVNQNICTICEQDGKKVIVVKLNNKYKKMTSICAVLMASFG